MDFALFMEKYGYKLILVGVVLIIVGVIGGFFLVLFGGLIRFLMILGLTKIEAVRFIVFFLVVILIATVVGHFMTMTTSIQGKTR